MGGANTITRFESTNVMFPNNACSKKPVGCNTGEYDVIYHL